MTKREIAFMACRLMALYLFMNSIFLLSSSLSAFNFLGSMGISSTSGVSSMTITLNNRPATLLEMILLVLFRLLPTALNWLGAFALWFFAPEVSNRLFENGPSESENEPRFTFGTEVRAVAFACLGLFFLAQDIPSLCLWMLNSVWSYFVWTRPSPFMGYGYRLGWEWLIRIPFSLWLVFGLRGLAGLWRTAQEKGLAPVDIVSRSD